MAGTLQPSWTLTSGQGDFDLLFIKYSLNPYYSVPDAEPGPGK